MKKKSAKNFSFSFKNDFFDEIKNEEDASGLNMTPKMNRIANKKYNIKSSLFFEKNEFISDLEASRFSRNDISTNISEIKRNDYSYLSKIEDSDKSGILLLIIYNRFN